MAERAGARLDSELVRRGLARSRRRAAELVSSGRVTCDGARATKVSAVVAPSSVLEVTADPADPGYASRAGGKLAGVLEALAALPADGDRGPVVDDARCLDLGASTGGFTDVLLRAGAREVVAVDVGHDQLVPELRTDPRVQVHEASTCARWPRSTSAPRPTWSWPTCRSSRSRSCCPRSPPSSGRARTC
ncbi:SAM-dependent methyltransferase [Cellulosimicrobium sp. CUA-896]|uniref:SAM-dependent methyltransferase n=1 Tax=Cellulosimicrobium sp. CUA-896 TaxID=1517881 RepID=UPI0009664E3B|nr:hypothetical protein BJF88_01750 [Cellulosimicrobium sp. CUA-896]